MESSKPLSVHMTHEEYETYKKYLELMKTEKTKVFYGRKKTESYGSHYVEYEIYSEDDVKLIADSFLQAHIDKLKEEIKSKTFTINDLLQTIKRQEYTIAMFNSYDYSGFKKSWWRSLWS